MQNNEAIDAGNYAGRAILLDKINTRWDDGTTEDKILNWKIEPKQIEVIWGNETSFIYNGKSHAPTVTTPLTGVNGEKVNIKVEGKNINVGSYTATASISSVTGGQEKASNYSLKSETTTKEYIISNKQLSGIVIAEPPTKTEYVEGQNFDKTGMMIKAVYNDGSEKEVTNYTVENGSSLKVSQTSVTIKYTEGSVAKTITQKITVKEKLIFGVDDYDLTEEEGIRYIGNIQEKTTIKDLKRKIKTNGTIDIYKGDSKITDENVILGTGMTIIIKLNNEEENYNVIVKGDLTGDGQIKMADVLKLARYKAGIDKNLEGAYLRAGDVVKDEKIGMPDILKLSRVLAGIENL